MKKKKPKFKRQFEGNKERTKLKDVWRKPKGRHSKQRLEKKHTSPVVKIGYGTAKKIRFLRRGLREIRVSTPKDLDKVDPKKEMIIIASSVGLKKKLEIMKKAEEKKIKISSVRTFK